MTLLTDSGLPARGILDFAAFMIERHEIACRRWRNEPPPWTRNQVLATYKFTNVFRRLDRVSVWLEREWYNGHQDDSQLWFACAVARLVNQPSTLSRLEWPIPWTGDKAALFAATLDGMLARKPRPAVFRSAYVIPSDLAGKGMSKPQRLAQVFTEYWERRDEVNRVAAQPECMLGLLNFTLKTFPLLGGGFLTAQLIGDWKWSGQLDRCSDLKTFAVSGPGSRRGIADVLRIPYGEYKHCEAKWFMRLGLLRSEVERRWPKCWPMPDNQDLQSCLCEFSKYRRVLRGELAGRQKYKQAEERPLLPPEPTHEGIDPEYFSEHERALGAASGALR